jgi:hypothetical protein
VLSLISDAPHGALRPLTIEKEEEEEGRREARGGEEGGRAEEDR